MPLYEYRCRECDANYQKLERVSALSNGTCPKCGGEATRLIGAPALQFKGAGWYVNDYGKSMASASESTSATASESTCPSSKEAAPATSDSSSKAPKGPAPASDKVA